MDNKNSTNNIIKNINEYSFGYIVKNISVVKYSPQIRHRCIKKRALSSYMYIIDGRYRYKSDDIDFIAESGDTIYIPCSSSYEYTILSDKTECIQTEFSLEENKNGKIFFKTFDKNPFVLKKKDDKLNLLFSDLLNQYQSDEFLTLSSIYKLLSIFKNACQQKHRFEHDGRYKIEPAINFIRHNFKNKIYISELAEMCNISQSHLRRLFNKYLGFSPIEYKNSILIKAACDMLRSGNINVSETAEALNFTDIYTFSQFFKKETGVSPTNYMCEHKGNLSFRADL